MNEKMNECVFMDCLGLQRPDFIVDKYFFCHQVPIPKFTKTCFTAILELCRYSWDIVYHYMKKDVRESVLWLLTAIPVVTLISWNCTVRWLTRKKYQASPIFQKTQNIDQICCFNERKMTQHVFLTGLRLQKIFQGRVFCEGWLPKSLLHWLGETVLDGFWFAVGSILFISEKTHHHDGRCFCNSRENELVCFSGKCKAATI